MKLAIKQIVLLSGLFLSSQVFAWYQVEMIVFENLDVPNGGETFNHDPGMPNLDKGVFLKSSGEGEGLVPYQALPLSRSKMGGVYGALRSSAEYRPIMHVNWQQPSVGRPHVKFVRINRTGVNAEELVDGIVRIRASHLLHADLDLALFTGAANHYRLTQTRKIKLKEVHYFDHPKFGVILLVNRL